MFFPLICRRGWEVMLLLPTPPSGFYHILKAVLEGPISGFWLSPSVGINIELQECAACWLGKQGGCCSLFWTDMVLLSLVCGCSPIKQPVTLKNAHTVPSRSYKG